MTKIGHRFDWLMKSMKIFSFATLAFVLVYEIFVGVSKLNAKEMTYTSTTGRLYSNNERNQSPNFQEFY